MKKRLSIWRWIATYVEYGDSADGKARVLGVYNTPTDACNAVKKAAEQYQKDLCLDDIEVFSDSVSVGVTDECGCEYAVEKWEIPLLPTDADVWVH